MQSAYFCFFKKKISALYKTLNMTTDEKCFIFGYSRDLQHKSAIVLIVQNSDYKIMVIPLGGFPLA